MPVLAAAFVPGAPVLVPELAGAAGSELAGVRAAADAAVLEAVAAGGVGGAGGAGVPVVVLGLGRDTRRWDGDASGTFRPWGVDVRVGAPPPLAPGAGPHSLRPSAPPPGLPLALTAAAWWLDRAGVPRTRRTYQELAPEGPAPAAPEGDVVLLVVGEGSSTRTPKAPGAFHPEAEAYDRAAARALATGDPMALAALDEERARLVGASGARAWGVAAVWWGEVPAVGSHVDADEAPYGVGYLVGVWTR